MSTTNIAIANEFEMQTDDYHEFITTKQTLERTVGLIYSYKEVQAYSWAGSKTYRAIFTLKGIRNPAQYSTDIE
jgi:hypothetical protein